MKKWAWILALYALAALGTWLGWWGQHWNLQQVGMEMKPPQAEAWFGTDRLGRDVFDQNLQGIALAMLTGFLAGGATVALGTILGLIAAGVPRLDPWFDFISAAVAAIPGLLLILTLGFMLGPGLSTVILAIAAVSWIGPYRQVRAECLRLQESGFYEAAVAAGATKPWLWRRHLLPHLLPLCLIQFSLYFVYAIKVEALVSFLGLGVLDQPSWGRMLAAAREDLPEGCWWPLTAATVAMFGLVLAVHRLSDSWQALPEQEMDEGTLRSGA